MDTFVEAFPNSLTSHDWRIQRNVFTRNGRAIRIAADQDHGIRSMPAEACGRPECRPHAHRILANDIQDNRVGIELAAADGTVIEENLLHRNVEASVRQEDCCGTVLRNNPGSAGAYL